MPGLPPEGEPHPTISEQDYDQRLRAAQLRMREVALAMHTSGERGVVVVEGTDTAGKGGAIQRLTAELDPRFFHVWPIGPPTDQERQSHYLQRFWMRLPPAGQIAIFDRSWYGRVLVERVERLLPETRWRDAYREIREFEAALTADGVKIAKFYLHVTEAEQQTRLIERARDPQKWWKISEADIRSHLAYCDYQKAAAAMLAETSTEAASWTVLPANDKRYTRLAVLDRVSDHFARGLDLDPKPMDKDLERLVREVLGVPRHNA